MFSIGTKEPNNDGGNEGFVHTWSKMKRYTLTCKGYTSYHPWNDITVLGNSENDVKAFIVEFQQ